MAWFGRTSLSSSIAATAPSLTEEQGKPGSSAPAWHIVRLSAECIEVSASVHARTGPAVSYALRSNTDRALAVPAGAQTAPLFCFRSSNIRLVPLARFAYEPPFCILCSVSDRTDTLCSGRTPALRPRTQTPVCIRCKPESCLCIPWRSRRAFFRAVP